MTEEKKVSRSHRLCPCNPMDIEGIQSWLEDMAAQGLILENESVFCGFWSFEKATPRKAFYRLEVIRGKFLEDTDTPREEMVETAEAMGWEYVTRYGSFYIYRSFDPLARPLHTDPELQSMTVRWLRRRCWSDLILDLIYVLVLFFLRRSSVGQVFLGAATVGLVYALCLLGLMAFFLLRPIANIYYLQRAIRKLKAVGTLAGGKAWRPKAPLWITSRILPMLFLIGVTGGLLSGLVHATEAYPLEQYSGSAPFLSIKQLYPDGTVTSRTDMGDYNTFLQWNTALSRNTQWTESGSITLAGESHHFILRLHIHETSSPWLAKGVFSDYYAEDAQRYNGKRFEAESTPETLLDEVKVYSSYGIRYILLRQGSTVIHGTVQIRHGEDPDRWEDWLVATEALLTRQLTPTQP